MEDTDKKFRNWTFTLNNYADLDLKVLQYMDCRYLVYGKEIAPTTGTPHLQGYVEFKNPRYLTALRKLHGNRAHWAPAKGDAAANFVYDTKDQDYYERGTPAAQGTRNDLKQVVSMIQAGASLKEIYLAGLGYQACRHAEKILQVLEPPRPLGPVKVFWAHGPPGIGKTHMPDLVCKTLGGKKLDSIRFAQGYDRHPIICVDDIRPTDDCCRSYVNLLHFMDRYEHQVEVKFGSRQLCAHTIFITSPLPPADFSYAYNSDENPEQLTRRITQVFDCNFLNGFYDLKKCCRDIIINAQSKTEPHVVPQDLEEGPSWNPGFSPDLPWLSS